MASTDSEYVREDTPRSYSDAAIDDYASNEAGGSAEESSGGSVSGNDRAENPNNELEVQWNYVRPDLIDVSHKVMMSGKENLIGTIRKKLLSYSFAVSTALENSALGVYMRYPDTIVKSGKCIHYIISREVRGTPDPDPTAVFYQVGDEDDIVRFSRVEFALMTGLRFGGSSFDPYKPAVIPRSSLYTRIFGKVPQTPNQVWTKFKDVKFVPDDGDVLKLCKVLIAVFIVLGLDPTNSKVPDWVWLLVENRKQWEEFPWGSMSYQVLVRQLTHVRRYLMKGGEGESYHLQGNSLAFLSWIYTAFPALGELIGMIGKADALPRGARFRYKKSWSDVAMSHIDQVHGVLEPTLLEMTQKFWKSIEPADAFFELNYDPSFERKREKEERERRPADAAAGTSTETGETSRKRMVEETADEVVKKMKTELFGGVDMFEAFAAFLKERYNKDPAPRGDGGEAGTSGQGPEDAHIRSPIRVPHEDSPPPQSPPQPRQEDSPIRSPLRYVHEESPPPQSPPQPQQEDSPSRSPRRDVHEESPPLQPQRESSPTSPESTAIISSRGPPPGRPVRRKFPSAVCRSPFRTQEVRGKNFAHFMTMDDPPERNVGLPFTVNKSYFVEIKAMTTMLGFEHVEPFVAILAKSPRSAYLKKANPRNVVMGSTFMTAVDEVWAKLHGNGKEPEGWVPDADEEEIVPDEELDRLAMFAEGLMPEWGGLKKWVDAHKLILMCHFSAHWAVCVLHMREGRMVLWDTNQAKFTDHIEALRLQVFRPLGRIFPQLLKYINYNEGKSIRFTEWKLEFEPMGPNRIIQDDSCSCGPLALKVMENRLCDKPDFPMDHDAIESWRTHMAQTIYEYSTDGSTLQF